MNLQEIHQEITKLGDLNTVPNSKASLDSQGNEVLYLRAPSVADKLKRLFMPREMRDVNRNRLISLIKIACQNEKIDTSQQAFIDVKKDLKTNFGTFRENLASLATIGALNSYSQGRNSLF